MSDSLKNCMRLIGLCLAPPEDSRMRLIDESARGIEDWDGMLRLCGARYISSLVFARLKAAGADGYMPDATKESFQRLYKLASIQNAMRLKQVLDVNALLSRQGISPLYMKGSALIMANDYAAPGIRMFADIDWLARKQHIEEYRKAFSDAGGWRELPAKPLEGWEVTSWANDWGNLVEVHWSLKPQNGVSSETTETRLWAGAQQVKYNGAEVLIPSRTDRFIQAALHGTAHHNFDTSYIFVMISDLAHVAGSSGSGLDTGVMVGCLREERMLEHAAVAAELARRMTLYEPLASICEELYAASPGLKDVTEPMVEALFSMVQKTWLFHSFYERRFFAKKSLAEWVSYFTSGIGRRLRPQARGKETRASLEIRDVEGVISKPDYRKKLWDRDMLRYIMSLRRFDRKIDYRMNIKDSPD